MTRTLLLSLCVVSAGCGDDNTPHPAQTPDAGADAAPTALVATLGDHRVLTADHMRASIEMQVSGEPFAQLLGYDVAGFQRAAPQPDTYVDPMTSQLKVEPLGWVTAIESYE